MRVKKKTDEVVSDIGFKFSNSKVVEVEGAVYGKRVLFPDGTSIKLRNIPDGSTVLVRK